MNKLKRILKRVVNPGKAPEEELEKLKKEGLLMLSERIRIVVKYKNFRAPGRMYYGKTAGTIGCLAITEQSMNAFTFFRCIMQVPFDVPHFEKMEFKVLKKNGLSVSFDPSVFDPKQSGNVEFRFYLPNIEYALDILKFKGVPL